MKKWTLYAVGLLLAVSLNWMPFQGSDVAQLKPVDGIFVQYRSDEILVVTDTHNTGRGETLQEAFASLKQLTPGQIFLETADYLLINEAAVALLPELTGYLRPACNVCVADDDVEIDQAVQYLSAHPPETTLHRYRQQKVLLEKLTVREGELCFEPWTDHT